MDNQSLVIAARHGAFFLLVGTMNKQIQVKYQSTPSSPYDTQKMVTSAFLVALFVYATASLAEVTPRVQESVYLRRLVGNTHLFAGAITAVFLLVLLIPAWG
ncbi:hypothetical protein OIU84_015928 [Salix udensis]|uniref:Uncharacterized protein n=1 Tax=Salix udensis TaxID=889485 RepID=A0AAD6NNZ9_9ROSI|nr:hypothetical protein OIU84_015928 [Salix udensis]